MLFPDGFDVPLFVVGLETLALDELLTVPLFDTGDVLATASFFDTSALDFAIYGHSYEVKKVQTGTKHHDAVTHQETRTVTVTPAYDETVVVKQAYDETVTTGYKCSCGATK